MQRLQYILILFFLPCNCVATEETYDDETDKMCTDFKEKISLDEDEYLVDRGLSWVIDKGYNKFARPLLKAIPYAGELFSEQAEQLEVPKSTLGNIEKMAKEAKRTNEHISSLCRFYKRDAQVKKKLTQAWKKANATHMLLGLTEEVLEPDTNPNDTLSDISMEEEAEKQWHKSQSKEAEPSERIEAFHKIDKSEMTCFAINQEIEHLLQQIKILEAQSKFITQKITSLQSQLKNENTEEEERALSETLEKEIDAFIKNGEKKNEALKGLKKAKQKTENHDKTIIADKVTQFEKIRINNFYRKLAHIEPKENTEEEKKVKISNEALAKQVENIVQNNTSTPS